MVIDTDSRVNIDQVKITSDGTLDVALSHRLDIDDLDRDEARERLEKVKKTMLDFAEDKEWGPYMKGYISQWETMEAAAGAMSPWIVETNEERYEILAEDSRKKRFEMMENLIYENLEVFKINTEAKLAQEEKYQQILVGAQRIRVQVEVSAVVGAQMRHVVAEQGAAHSESPGRGVDGEDRHLIAQRLAHRGAQALVDPLELRVVAQGPLLGEAGEEQAQHVAGSAQAVGEAAGQARAALDRRQIGRASCRERV